MPTELNAIYKSKRKATKVYVYYKYEKAILFLPSQTKCQCQLVVDDDIDIIAVLRLPLALTGGFHSLDSIPSEYPPEHGSGSRSAMTVSASRVCYSWAAYFDNSLLCVEATDERIRFPSPDIEDKRGKVCSNVLINVCSHNGQSLLIKMQIIVYAIISGSSKNYYKQQIICNYLVVVNNSIGFSIQPANVYNHRVPGW